MKTINRQNTQTTTAHDDVNQAGRAGIATIAIVSTLMGAWGMACLMGGLATSGITGIVTGFITAVTGM